MQYSFDALHLKDAGFHVVYEITIWIKKKSKMQKKKELRHTHSRRFLFKLLDPHNPFNLESEQWMGHCRNEKHEIRVLRLDGIIILDEINRAKRMAWPGSSAQLTELFKIKPI